MTKNLSVVNIASDSTKDDVNTFAYLCGCGENSLSVKLQDSSGNIFWACHSWWSEEDYTAFKSLDIPDQYKAAMSALYERKVIDGNPLENLTAAMEELGLDYYSDPN